MQTKTKIMATENFDSGHIAASAHTHPFALLQYSI